MFTESSKISRLCRNCPAFLFAFTLLVTLGVMGVSGALADSHSPGAKAQETQNVAAAVPAHWPPQYNLDDTGVPTGFAIDIMEAVAARAGLNVTYVVKPSFLEATRALEKGEVDLVPNYGIVPKRMKNLSATTPLETFRISLFVRKDTRRFHDLGPYRRIGPGHGRDSPAQPNLYGH